MRNDFYSVQYKLFIYDEFQTKNMVTFKVVTKNSENNVMDYKPLALEISNETLDGFRNLIEKFLIQPTIQRDICYKNEDQLSVQNYVTNSYLVPINQSRVETKTFFSNPDVHTPLLKPESGVVSNSENWMTPENVEILQNWKHSKIILQLTPTTYVALPKRLISGMVSKLLDVGNDDTSIMMTISALHHENPFFPYHREQFIVLHKSELNKHVSLGREDPLMFARKEGLYDNQMIIMSITNYQNKKVDVGTFSSPVNNDFKVEFVGNTTLKCYDNKNGYLNVGQLEDGSFENNINNSPTKEENVNLIIESDEELKIINARRHIPPICLGILILKVILVLVLILYCFFK